MAKKTKEEILKSKELAEKIFIKNVVLYANAKKEYVEEAIDAAIAFEKGFNELLSESEIE